MQSHVFNCVMQRIGHGRKRIMTEAAHGSLLYLNDAPFWYVLARRVSRGAEGELPPLFDLLNRRSTELGLPIVFSGIKALSWAAICRLFVLYNVQAPTMKRQGYLRMVGGAKQAFEHRRFPQIALKRLVANIAYPSSSDRSVKESIADTFLANGLTVTDEYTDSSWDDVILSRSLADTGMMSLCDQIVTPPDGLWEDVVNYYRNNRPGFFYRISFNVKTWIIT